MGAESISPVGKDEVGRAFDTLVSAFTHDPLIRWLYPEARQYETHFPALVAGLGGKAFAHETAWSLGAFSAVALWLPPDEEPDGDALVAALTEGVSAGQHEDTLALVDQVDEAHPEFRHWYLPWFGVHDALQGKGLGGELMRHCLAIVDASHLPAYLETPNPRNIPFYERHGFEVTGEARAGACPPLTFMLRPAQ